MKKITLIDNHSEGSGCKIAKTAKELEQGTRDWILCLGDNESKKNHESSFKKNKIRTICKCYEENQGFEVVSKGYQSLTHFLEVNLDK